MDILGIGFSNDSAAALVRDGEVIAACQEERFSRVKHDRAFPHRAIEFCLSRSGGGLEDLEAVAFFWNPGIHAEAPTRRFASSPRHNLEFLYSVPTNLLAHLEDARVDSVDQTLRLRSGGEISVHYVTHHACHAACAFYPSPFDEAAILTADGYGERQSTVIAHGRGTRIEPVLEVEFPHSLGALYAAFTQYLGFLPNSGEGKVMGLAPYGGPSDVSDPVREMVRLTDDGFELDLRCFEFFHDRPRRYNDRLVRLLGPERAPGGSIERRHEDVAFALQEVTESAMLHLARLARERTGSRRLCVAGGVGLNCVANGRIAAEAGFDGLFFYPAAGDAGAAAGAALWAWHAIRGGARSGAAATDYLGPEFDREAALAVLDRARVDRVEVPDAPAAAARMIADGLFVGWFQGRSEFGPRALGNRSILADPRRAEVKDLLNARVKLREPFRPYAPSILEEACGEYFSSAVPSPFMLRAYATRPEKAGEIPAVTHVDGTARVQTVGPDRNPRYRRLLRELAGITGVPAVLNTSFNVRGEPIVNGVEDALGCFYTTGLDALFVGDFALLKDPARSRRHLG